MHGRLHAMSWLVRSPITLLLLAAAVLIASTRMLVGQGDLMRRVAHDDWRGVRDEATALVTGARRAHPVLVDHAALLLAVAQLVLGDLRAARAAADEASRRSLAPPLQAALQRQLASIERIEGDRAAALARLAEPGASSGDDEWGVAAQVALVHLGRLDGPAAVAAVRPAVAQLDARLRGALTSAQRDAYEADLAQLQCMLVRGLLLSGATEEAGTVWAARTQPAHKPYVNGQLCETGARLAAARHDMAAASQQADAAVGWYRSVGAAIDEARAQLLVATSTGDRPALDAAEAELHRLGALGYLDEVEAARRGLDAQG